MQVWLYCLYLVCRGMLAGVAVCVPACYAVVRRFDVERSRWPARVLVPIGRVLGFTSLSGKRPRSFLKVEAESPAGLAAHQGFSGFRCLPGSGTSTSRAPSQAPVDQVWSIGPLTEGTVPSTGRPSLVERSVDRGHRPKHRETKFGRSVR